jgi:microcystin-dependent protein
VPTLKYRAPDGTFVPLIGVPQAEADANYVSLSGSTMTGNLNVQEPVAAANPATKRYVDTVIPVGTISMLGQTTAPTGWLICDGAAVSRTTYAALFAVVSTLHGVGDGSTTFNLPDLRGRVAAGLNASDPYFDVMSDYAGASTHTLTPAEVPNASGNVNWHGGGSRTSAWNASGTWIPNGYIAAYANPQYHHAGAPSAGIINFNYGGGGGAHNNTQPYAALHFAIRT